MSMMVNKPIVRNRPEYYYSYREAGYDNKGNKLYIRDVNLDLDNKVEYCPICHNRLCSRYRNYCPSCGAMMNLGGIGMRKYTVVEYEESDFDELRDNMTNEEAANILDLLPRGYFPYSHPSYRDNVTERDYENYKICCALRLAMKALYGKGDK